MEFRTQVILPPQEAWLMPTSAAVTIGSCFAAGVGDRIADSLAADAALVNPFGVVYNPLSAATVVERLLACDEEGMTFPETEFFEARDGRWRCWQCAGEVEGESLQACRDEAEKRRSRGAALLRRADLLVVTFGTDRAYFFYHPGEEQVVANCHKMPAALFRERTLGEEEIIGHWSPLLKRLRTELPELKVVLTVSPYRYLKYGLHESALSKARLLLAVDRLCREHENAIYFPAYEIVMDELRDYRFYDADMVHPSPVAVTYVCERFSTWAFTPILQQMAAEKAALLRDYRHRPLHPDSPEAKTFYRRREERRRIAEERWRMRLI